MFLSIFDQRPAYFTPEVDSSDEPFAWGFPNLDQLRTYLADELSWSVSKVDDELTPIVQRIARRGHGLQSGLNKQGTLDGVRPSFFFLFFSPRSALCG
jgi:DNA excision repair protein ERCC-5